MTHPSEQPSAGSRSSAALTPEQVRHVATLARLELDDAELAEQGERLAAVLGYIERLGELDLDGVQPLTHPGDIVNRLDDDEPGEMLDAAVLEGIAPSLHGRFIRVPKVIGGSES